MQMIYNSPQYCVVEFADFEAGADAASGGFEIMDKALRREIFLRGKDADVFRASVGELIAREPSLDEFDDFLHNYAGMMHTPVVLH